MTQQEDIPLWARILSSIGEKTGATDAINFVANPPQYDEPPISSPLIQEYIKRVSSLSSPALAAILSTLERAEEVGQLAASPVVQQIAQPSPGGLSAGLLRGVDTQELAQDYIGQAQSFMENIRAPDGGLDFQGATRAATDTGEYSPGVVGLAGVLGDPLNLIPGPRLTSRIGKGVADVAIPAMKAPAFMAAGLGGPGGVLPPRRAKNLADAWVPDGDDLVLNQPGIELRIDAPGTYGDKASITGLLGGSKVEVHALEGVEGAKQKAQELIADLPEPIVDDSFLYQPPAAMPRETAELFVELRDHVQTGKTSIPQDLRARIRDDEYLKEINYKIPKLTSGKTVQGASARAPWIYLHHIEDGLFPVKPRPQGGVADTDLQLQQDNMTALLERAGVEPKYGHVTHDELERMVNVELGEGAEAETAFQNIVGQADASLQRSSRQSSVDPAGITVGYRSPEGELEALPGFMDQTRTARRQIIKNKAKEYQELLETEPRVPVEPDPPLIEPRIVDEVPTAMQQRSVQASRAQGDPFPSDLNSPSLIDPESPGTAYRAFRSQTDSMPGDVITNQRKALIASTNQDTILEGARLISGDTEVERLRGLMGDGVIPNDPPPPLTPDESSTSIGDGSGTGNIIEPSAAGDGKKPPRPPKKRSGGKDRFGAPQVFGRIHSGGYSFPTMPGVDHLFASMRRENTWQWIADKISLKYPALVRVVNAAGTLASAPVEAKGLIAIEVMRERMNRGLAPMFAQLDRIGSETSIFGAKDEAGDVTAILKDGTETQVLVGQIAENPSRYQLTDEQRLWIDTAQEINQVPKRILEAHGQKVNDYLYHTEFFVGRRIVAKRDKSGEIIDLGYVGLGDRKGLSGKATTTKAREFDSLEEVKAEGYIPEPSYSRTLMLRSMSAGREAVNIRVGHWLAQQLKRGIPGVEVVPGRGPVGTTQHEIEVLVNTSKEGVQRHVYRLDGPQAQRLKAFTDRLGHEWELREANKILNAASRASSTMRFLQLTADTSIFVIQGLQSWGSRPIATARPFAKAGLQGLHALKDPETVRRARAAAIDDFAQRGGFEKHPNLIVDYGGFSEFTEAAGGAVGRIPVAGEGLQRFALMFDHVRDMMAITHADITEQAAKHLADGPAKQAFIDAQDSMTNMLLGRLSMQRLGISGTQRQVEGGFLFLAPQYYRATFGMLTMALEGGVRGNQARKLLAKSLGTLALIIGTANYASSRIRGDSHDRAMRQTRQSINPSSGEFASVRVDLPGEADIRVGLGGSVRAVMSLLMEMIVGEEFLTDEEKFNTGIAGRARTAVGFGEARLAPVSGLAKELVTGRDFIGQNTSALTPRGLLRLATNNLLPIFLQNAIDEWDNQNVVRSLAQAGTGAMGLNSRDLGTQDVREWAAQEVYRDIPYNALDSWEKNYVNALARPQLQRLYERRVESQPSKEPTHSNLALIDMQGKDRRESTLLDLATDSQMDTSAKYFSWIRADEFQRGQTDAIGELYDIIFDERPDRIPENEVEEAFSLWIQIFEIDDENQKAKALATFERIYPASSEVGQYVRRQTNQRRVPLVLLRQLGNYSRAKGVLYSAYARAAEIYRKVHETEGSAVASEKFNEYLMWFFMVPETLGAVPEQAQQP